MRSRSTCASHPIARCCTRQIDDHPIRALIDAGVKVTINTDDPETLGITLCSELELAARHLGWSDVNVLAAQHRAVDATFATESVKAQLRTRLGEAG